MAKRSRKAGSVSSASKQDPKNFTEGEGRLSCQEALANGVDSVAGAARFSIAAAEDMLSGRITPQEATVVNTSAGRVLKAAELYLKYNRRPSEQLQLPE